MTKPFTQEQVVFGLDTIFQDEENSESSPEGKVVKKYQLDDVE